MFLTFTYYYSFFILEKKEEEKDYINVYSSTIYNSYFISQGNRIVYI